jgi:predicted lipoprotein with Yx(FWY)xxD motif
VKTLKRAAALVLVAALGALTACDSSDPAPSSAPAASASAEAAGEPATTLTAPAPQRIPTPQPEKISLTAGKATVDGAESDVVRFKDRIVYRFEADGNKPSKVNCAADCLIVWPPLLTDGTPVQLSGVDPKLVGSVTRADGFTQVTLAGWPLYLFKNDQSAADTNGEGVGGNWSVVGPDGKAVVQK